MTVTGMSLRVASAPATFVQTVEQKSRHDLPRKRPVHRSPTMALGRRGRQTFGCCKKYSGYRRCFLLKKV